MKTLFLTSFCILALLVGAVPAQPGKPAAAKPQTAPPYEMPMSVKTLSNGMQIIVTPDHSVPLVTLEIAVRNGSFTEPPELNGLSHLYEHMFFRTNHATALWQCEHMEFSNQALFKASGCENEMALKDQIGDVGYQAGLEDMGVAYNGETHEEVVEYYYNTTSPYLVPSLKALKDAIRYPKFDEEEFNSEKQAVIGELDRNFSNPYGHINDDLLEHLFYKYPTRKKPEGTRETVAAATTDQMRLIQSRYYVPNNTVLVVSGD
ncbi:MAG: insulinase family protein, partial [Acidobacteria bacterium]|nr:insulinase family protein [Acidobacteriota bacterium]